MRINEVEDLSQGADPNELVGLVKFLNGRATDTNAKKQISKSAFISAANSLGINITPENVDEIIAQPPLNGVLEPINPQQPDTIFYKGAGIGPAKMSVPQAQQVVNKMAKSAMKRGM